MISSTRKSPLTVTCINDVVLILQNKPEWMHLFSELVKLLRLFLTMPATSCSAERSFSCLRRLKTYLRSTLTQQCLSHVALLHCHRERSDLIDLREICNAFIAKNDLGASTFDTFYNFLLFKDSLICNVLFSGIIIITFLKFCKPYNNTVIADHKLPRPETRWGAYTALPGSPSCI